ncbi:MAG: hypothetical protein HY791_37295 [Deltaproteobacteria bacterium]|nr:hypothetical protein [Deltaproteobacteria bacterium]
MSRARVSGPFMDGPGSAAANTPELADVITRLSQRSKTGMVLGLDRMERVLEALGRPERAYRIAHVVGSNGKGSTCAFLASISSHRFRVGLYTSPHLVKLTERVQWVSNHEFEPMSEHDFAAALERVESIDSELTFFEWVTAAALLAFRDGGAELVVLEAGLGARLDATRAAHAEVAVVTDLSLEHTEILGQTIEEIAAEKAAAIRPRTPVVIAGGAGESVLRARAQSLGSPCFGIGKEISVEWNDEGLDLALPDRRISGVELGLAGTHQGRNAVLAASAAVLMDPVLDEVALRQGLSRTQWPGRLQSFGAGPALLIDGAHNVQGAQILAEHLRSKYSNRSITLVFGALGGKRADEMLRMLVPLAERVILTRANNPRSEDPMGLVSVAGATAEVVMPAKDALLRALGVSGGGLIVVSGSLYLVGELLPEILAFD